MNKLWCLLLIVIFCSCTSNSRTEKYQKQRNKVINVRDQVKEIEIKDVLIGSIARLYLLKNYLIIGDYKTQDKLIHIFNKNNFNYLTSTAYLGQAPGEIANMGYIETDEAHDLFYVSDHGKEKIFSYDLDSVLTNPLYMPKVKMEMNARSFPSKYQYINDTLCIGLIIKPTGNSGYKQSVAKWNMTTSEITPMKYEHPEIEKKRISFAVSVKHGIYVECYSYHDLMTICSLNGDLKCNIYGPNWDNRTTNKVSYYGTVRFCGDKIFVLYSGEDTFYEDKNKGTRTKLPTKFLVFDINGNYLQTLETGYQISDFCYDMDNHRIILSLDDVIQFAYLDVDGFV